MPIFSTARSSNRQLKLEMLLFRSGQSLYASRTNSVASLADLPKELVRDTRLKQWLSPRLFAAFAGQTRIGQAYIFSFAQLLESPMIIAPKDVEVSDDKSNRVILLNNPNVKIGLLVDEIVEVRSIELTQLKPIPPFIEQVRQRKAPWALLKTEVNAENLAAELDQKMLMVLDLPGLFNEAEWLLLDNLNKAELETAI